MFKSLSTLNQKTSKHFPKRSKKEARVRLVKNMKASILNKIPKVKPLPLWMTTSFFAGLAWIGLSIGATIGTYVFFGIATLAGLIAIAESNRYVRWLITKSTKAIDIAIFLATVYATAILGVTVSAALVFAGLGYSLVYAPWLRQREELISINNELNQ